MTAVMRMVYDRIRELREDHVFRLVNVAKMLGMSRTGYSKYETGENDVLTTLLIKLAGIYKTSADCILEPTENPEPYSERS